MFLGIITSLVTTKIGRYIAMGLISVVIVLSIISKIKRDERQKIENKRTRARLRNLQEMIQNEDEINGLTPDVLDERMSRWTKR